MPPVLIGGPCLLMLAFVLLTAKPHGIGARAANLNGDYAYAGKKSTLSSTGSPAPGTGSFVTFGSDPWFYCQNLTIEFWVKPTIENSKFTGMVGSLFDNGREEAGVQFQADGANGTMLLIAGGPNGIDYTFSVPTPLNQWTHVAGVVQNQIAYIYVNGSLNRTRNVETEIHYTTPQMQSLNWGLGFYIGRFHDSNEDYRYVGLIDEVRFWNYSRTPEQIAASYNVKITAPEPGLLLLVNFDDYDLARGSPAVPDMSGFNRNGSLSGGQIVSSASLWGSGTPLRPYPTASTCVGLRSILSNPRSALYSLASREIYCDYQTAGGSWMLMSQIVQPQNVTAADLDPDIYSRLVLGDVWIDGYPGLPPTSPNASYSSSVAINSHNWMEFLKDDSIYQIRVEVYKGPGTDRLDTMFVFHFLGTTMHATPTRPSLTLSGKEVLAGSFFKSTTKSSFQKLVPPYAATDDVNPVACIDGAFGPVPCGSTRDTAGVMAIVDNADAANNFWAPFFMRGGDPRVDIAYIPSHSEIYGHSMDAMAVNLWMREVAAVSYKYTTATIGHAFYPTQRASFDYLADSSGVYGGSPLGAISIDPSNKMELRVSASPTGTQFVVTVDASVQVKVEIDLKWCTSGAFPTASNITSQGGVSTEVLFLNSNPLSYSPTIEMAPESGFYDNGRCLRVLMSSESFNGYLDFRALSIFITVSGFNSSSNYLLQDLSYMRFRFTGPFAEDPGRLAQIADNEAPVFTSCQDYLNTTPVAPGANAAIGYWRIPEARDNTATVLVSSPVVCSAAGQCFPSMQISSATTSRTRYASFPIEYSPYIITYTASDLSNNSVKCVIRMAVDYQPTNYALNISFPTDAILGLGPLASPNGDLQVTQVLAGSYNGLTSSVALPSLCDDLRNKSTLALSLESAVGYALRVANPTGYEFQGKLSFSAEWKVANGSLPGSASPRCGGAAVDSNFSLAIGPNDVFVQAQLEGPLGSLDGQVRLVVSSVGLSRSGIRITGTFATLSAPMDIVRVRITLFAPRGHLRLVSGLPLVPTAQSFVLTDFYSPLYASANTSPHVVSIQDYVDPILRCPASSTVQTLPGSKYGLASWGSFSALDNVDPTEALKLVFSIPVNTSLSIGQHENTMTAFDSAGNSGSCLFLIAVVDKEPPVLVCPQGVNQTVLRQTDTNLYNVNFNAPNASDNSGVPPSLSISKTSGGLFSMGSTEVLVIATDSSNNTAVCSFLITLSLPPSDSSSSSVFQLWQLSLIFIVLIILILLFIFLYLRHRRNKKKNRTHNFLATYKEMGIDAHTHAPKEISRASITMVLRIGGGAFGEVFKAFFTPPEGNTPKYLVAVKTLKANPTSKEMSDFLAEAALMALIEPHPNLINLIGVCTMGEPILLVIEFAEHGSLLQFIKDFQISENSKNIICRDVARGMLHLSQKGFVHRDLSARNVLLSSDFVAKVSDFGLSRDLEDENYYTSQGGQVPVRWTAIEALEDRKYSTASDVWSFGITVFEVFTRGEVPYKSWSNAKVWLQVKDGYRLPCPPSISDHLYSLLLRCWDEHTENRPTFADILEILDPLCKGGNETILAEVMHDAHSGHRGTSYLGFRKANSDPLPVKLSDIPLEPFLPRMESEHFDYMQETPLSDQAEHDYEYSSVVVQQFPKRSTDSQLIQPPPSSSHLRRDTTLSHASNSSIPLPPLPEGDTDNIKPLPSKLGVPNGSTSQNGSPRPSQSSLSDGSTDVKNRVGRLSSHSLNVGAPLGSKPVSTTNFQPSTLVAEAQRPSVSETVIVDLSPDESPQKSTRLLSFKEFEDVDC